jgi:hypothetical protein
MNIQWLNQLNWLIIEVVTKGSLQKEKPCLKSGQFLQVEYQNAF